MPPVMPTLPSYYDDEHEGPSGKIWIFAYTSMSEIAHIYLVIMVLYCKIRIFNRITSDPP